jgi:hypothetical protein
LPWLGRPSTHCWEARPRVARDRSAIAVKRAAPIRWGIAKRRPSDRDPPDDDSGALEAELPERERGRLRLGRL